MRSMIVILLWLGLARDNSASNITVKKDEFEATTDCSDRFGPVACEDEDHCLDWLEQCSNGPCENHASSSDNGCQCLWHLGVDDMVICSSFNNDKFSEIVEDDNEEILWKRSLNESTPIAVDTWGVDENGNVSNYDITSEASTEDADIEFSEVNAIGRTWPLDTASIYVHRETETGSIPLELGLLTKLTSLYIFDTDLAGTIPTELGLLTELIYASLDTNDLTGTLPSELGLLTDLTRLIIKGTDLTGTIPSELGLLTALTWLSLPCNELLTGMLPSELGALTLLHFLRITDDPSLSGPIPTEVCELASLTQLHTADCDTLPCCPQVTLFCECGQTQGCRLSSL